jgi:hypothetical protein
MIKEAEDIFWQAIAKAEKEGDMEPQDEQGDEEGGDNEGGEGGNGDDQGGPG